MNPFAWRYHLTVLTSPPALFPTLLGAAFEQLPDVVQRLHLRGSSSYHGEVVVTRGTGWLSRFCAWAARLPPAFAGPIRVEIECLPKSERWTRHVHGHAMRSRLWAGDGLLCEQLGPLTFGFQLTVVDQQLRWKVEHVRALGLPLPSAAFGAVNAVESVDAGRYTFDVSATLPVVGLLVHYRGWLDVP
jgi:hypothetical protein